MCGYVYNLRESLELVIDTVTIKLQSLSQWSECKKVLSAPLDSIELRTLPLSPKEINYEW